MSINHRETNRSIFSTGAAGADATKNAAKRAIAFLPAVALLVVVMPDAAWQIWAVFGLLTLCWTAATILSYYEALTQLEIKTIKSMDPGAVMISRASRPEPRRATPHLAYHR